MNYYVTGQRNVQGKWEEHRQDFDTYSEAALYYSQIFSQVAEDICDLGGELVFTLVAMKDDGGIEIMKRHIVSTTILL